MVFSLDKEESERYSYHVYDPNTSKIIAIFKEGKFETSDKDLCNRLVELGYKPEKLEENQIEEIIEVENPQEKKAKGKIKKK